MPKYRYTIYTMSHQIIILGSGPAGLTAAIYASRAGLSPLVVEGHEPGGQLTTTTEIENFPGFADPIQGPLLMQNMRQQAERLGTKFLSGNVVKIETQNDTHRVVLDQGEPLESKAVIVATGASARWLGLESETRLRGRGVSSCATCDGFFFRNKDVVVVGGGDTAFQDALYLSRVAKSVVILHRSEHFRASQENQKRVAAEPKTSVMTNVVIEEVLGEQVVSGVRIKNVVTGEVKEIAAQGLFVAIGHTPNTGFLKSTGVELDETGYMKTRDHVYTAIPGVFAAGDVEDHVYRQAITAAGFGCMAALAAERYLRSMDT